MNGKKDFVLKILILLTVIILIIARQPELFYQPRFYAEEGSNYFSYAFSHSFFQNLIHPQFGYNTLYNSLATSFAAMFQLEKAPFVTTYLAFIVQILTSASAIWADVPGLNSILKRFVVAISIQFLFISGVWLSTLSCQYMLYVIVFIILMENPISRSTIAVIMRSLFLLLSGLTGVISCLLAPVYLYKTIITKSKQFAVYTLILTLSFITQLLIFINTYFEHNNEISNRFISHNSNELITILFKFITFQFYVPFFGRRVMLTQTYQSVDATISSKILLIDQLHIQIIPVVIGLLVIIFIIVLFCKRIKELNSKIFMSTLLIVTLFSNILSINMSGGFRYTFIPSIMILIFIMTYWQSQQANTLLNNTITGLILIMIIINGSEYRTNITYFAYNELWPKWTDEVRCWRGNHKYLLKTWPESWEMSLK